MAGFADSELSIETRENTLTVRGSKETAQKGEGEKREVLYQGIAARAFERRFQLADHVFATGATSQNGLLHIDLVREVPEAQKPRTLEINKVGKPVELSRSADRQTGGLSDVERAAFSGKGVLRGALFLCFYSSGATGTSLSAGLGRVALGAAARRRHVSGAGAATGLVSATRGAGAPASTDGR